MQIFIFTVYKYITFKTFKSIVSNVVLYTLSYCNIILVNLTAKYLEPVVKFK